MQKRLIVRQTHLFSQEACKASALGDQKLFDPDATSTLAGLPGVQFMDQVGLLLTTLSQY